MKCLNQGLPLRCGWKTTCIDSYEHCGCSGGGENLILRVLYWTLRRLMSEKENSCLRLHAILS
jgi:hypothetical protein